MSTKTSTPILAQKIVETMNIRLSSIIPSKSNPRKSFDKESIQDLANSIKSVGLLQPVTLRPGKKDGFEIVAGERRYRAVKLLNWEAIPAIVRVISDEELLEIQIIENLQREDVNPLDEAHAFETLLKKEDIEWLASRIHKPKKYIQDRLKLNNLSEEAADYARKGVLPLGHAIVISKLSFADQQKCLQHCIDDGFGENTEEGYCKIPLEELKDFIADDIMLEFDKVSFDKNDETLYPEAGACANCPKRTCNALLLFNDITREDKCTDSACFHEKITRHVAREKEKAKETYGKVLAGEKSYNVSNGQIKVQGVAMKFSETPTKNAVPVQITKTDRFNKNEMGSIVYVDAKQLEGKETEKESQKSTGPKIPEWQQRSIDRMKNVTWPRLEIIKGLPIPVEGPAVVRGIAREFLGDILMERLDEEDVMAFAGVLGYNGFATDVDKAIENEDSYSPEFKMEKIGMIMDHYSNTEDLICVIAMLDAIGNNEDRTTNRKVGFGNTWSELMKIVGVSKPATKSATKSTKKKS